MLAALIIILFILIALIGGNRGIKSIIVLVINSFIILISLVLAAQGINTVIITLVSSIPICLTTIVMQNDYNVKSIASLTSTVLISIFICGFILIIGNKAHITGLNEIEKRVDSTEYYTSAVNLNMYGILIMSLIYGELGAIMDTAVSIATAQNEIHINNPDLSSGKIFRSGLTIGKDIIGTTVNTLSFVALGESLLLLIMYKINNYSFTRIVNSKSFFQEISGILLSCIGCIMIIPVTAFIFSRFIKSKKVLVHFENHLDKDNKMEEN